MNVFFAAFYPFQPLALIAYGCILRLRWADVKLAQDFIMAKAMGKDLEVNIWRDGDYKYALKRKAKLLSDFMDTDLCPGRHPTSPSTKFNTLRRFARTTGRGLQKSGNSTSDGNVVLQAGNPVSNRMSPSRSTHTATSPLTSDLRTSKVSSVTTSKAPVEVSSTSKTSRRTPGHTAAPQSTLRVSENSTACTNTSSRSSCHGQKPHLVYSRMAWSIVAVLLLAFLVIIGVVCMRPDACRCSSSDVVLFDQRRHKSRLGKKPLRKQLVRFAENLPMSHKSRTAGAADYRRLMQDDVDEDDV